MLFGFRLSFLPTPGDRVASPWRLGVVALCRAPSFAVLFLERVGLEGSVAGCWFACMLTSESHIHKPANRVGMAAVFACHASYLESVKKPSILVD